MRLHRLLMAATLFGLAFSAVPPAVSAQGNTWRERAPLPTPRRLLAAAAEGGRIYTFGGCGSPCYQPPLHTDTFEETLVEAYDPQSNRWERRATMRAILFEAAAAPGNGRIYTFGGVLTGDLVQEYDPARNVWTEAPKARMPTPRRGLAAVALGGLIYVVGGSGPSGATGALEVYDPVRDVWLPPRARLRIPRVYLAAAALNGKIYAVGGSPDCCGNASTNTVEVYDPATNTWSDRAPLPVALQTSAAAAVGGKLYVFGGFVPGQGVLRTTFEYDPEANAWNDDRAPLPTARDQAPAVVLPNPANPNDLRVHVLGGAVACHCQALANHDEYTPPTSRILEVDLGITKNDGLSQVCPGQSLRYEIVVTNGGPDAAIGALVRDPLPSKLENARWGCTAAGGAVCVLPGAGESLAHRVNLPAQGTLTYTLDAKVRAGAMGDLGNTASVKEPAGVRETAPGNNESTDVDRIGPDLAIDKDDGTPTARPEGPLLYTITVSNACSSFPVTGRVTDDLSGLLDARWCCGTGCAPVPADKPNLDATVTVPANGATTCTVAATAPCTCGATTVTNTACVARAGRPLPGLCDPDEDGLEPRPGADLAVKLTGDALLEPGGTAKYSIEVTNGGPCNAPAPVVLTLKVPDGFELVSASAPCTGGFPCTLPDLAPLAVLSPPVTATFRVPAGHPCPVPVLSTAHIAGRCDPNSTNDSSTHPSEVVCPLSITKTDGQTNVCPGRSLLYTIQVRNPGAAQPRALVTDDFPDEKLLDARWCFGAGCSPDRRSDLVDIRSLPAGDTVTYQASGIVSPFFETPFTLENTAKVELPDGTRAATDVDEVAPCPGVEGFCGTEAGYLEGDTITKRFVLLNGGPAAQMDNPGPEFEDELPAGLTLVDAIVVDPAGSGTITTSPCCVQWNGAIPVGGRVVIEITATVDAGTAGTTLCNQAEIHFDADGDGDNESSRSTDDPLIPGEGNACCAQVGFLPQVPVLSPAVLAVFALLLAVTALVCLRHLPTC